MEGRDVVFSCVVEGNPSPSVTWTKNEQRLNFTANSRLNASSTNNNHTLTITDVHRSDAGQYRCVANNSVNTSTSAAAKLEVNCKYHKRTGTLEHGGRSLCCPKTANARVNARVRVLKSEWKRTQVARKINCSQFPRVMKLP